MARVFRPTSAQKHQGYRSTSLARGEQPQGIRKTTPIRRSARLQQRRPTEQSYQSLSTYNSDSQDAQLQSITIQPADGKRKRSRGTDTSDRPAKKQRRSFPTATEVLHEEAASQEAASGETASESGYNSNPVDYWRKHLHWPQYFFESSSRMTYPLARKKSSSALRRKSSASSINSSNITPTQSDQKPREAKSAQYRDPRYAVLLAARGVFMTKSNVGISNEGKQMCLALLSEEQTVPEHSLFSDGLFQSTCEKVQNRNETRVVRDISPLLVPSAEALETYGATNLKCLIESTNEGWNNSIPITPPRPQPDYAVGFRREAFSPDRLRLLEPFVGTLWDESYFVATWYMYFPFLICEVKCGASSLDIADRQNTHSATLAVRAVVELFRLVKREKEVDREILAFSVSHDHSFVRIYGHYPVIEGKDTKYYRHEIHQFSFTSMDGKEKWTTYKFTKNVYNKWMPDHLKRIYSAIDEIPPDINFNLSQDSELQFSQTSLSQGLESQRLAQSEGSASAAAASQGGVLSVGNTDNMTPDTSITQSFKRPKRL